MKSRFGKIYDILPELVSSILAGVIYGQLDNIISNIFLKLFITVLITVLVFLLLEILLNNLVFRFHWVRKLVIPFSRFEGKWLAEVKFNERNLALIEIKYDFLTHQFLYNGESYNSDAEPTANWTSEFVYILNDNTLKYFANGYIIDGSKMHDAESAGYVIFNDSSFNNEYSGFGYTTDLGAIGSASILRKFDDDLMNNYLNNLTEDKESKFKKFIKVYFNKNVKKSQTDIMMDIYNENIEVFKNMSIHEDYEQHLKSFLMNNFEWNNKIVFELGCGLGRITKYYCDKVSKAYISDVSANMLNKCKEIFKNNIFCFNERNESIKNLNIHDANIIISSYSIGHSIIDSNFSVDDTFINIIKQCINSCVDNDSKIIIIENRSIFGKQLSYDYKLNEYFNLLDKYFNYSEIDTDYKFDDYSEAYDIMCSFYGNEVGDQIQKVDGVLVIPEKSGIWHQSVGNLKAKNSEF